jgi:hypothetical protein
MSLLSTSPGERAGTDLKLLPDGRYRITVREEMVVGFRVNDDSVTAFGTLVDKPIAGKYTLAAGARLIEEEFASTAASILRIRIYETMPATGEVMAGKPTRHTDENGREIVKITSLQLSADTYVPGTVGTSTPPAPYAALGVLTEVSAEDTGAVRTVTRAYIEATTTLTQIGGEEVTLDENGRKTVKATFIQLTSQAYTAGTVGTTAAPTTANCVLTGEKVEANSAVRTVMRVYIEATTTLTQIGAEEVTLDENGRKTVKATFIQLTSQAYTAGTVGTTEAPTTANCVLTGEKVEANSAVRTVVRIYIEAIATETIIGKPRRTIGQDGRETASIITVQLSSATYVPGTVGTSTPAAPYTALGVLSEASAEDTGAVRTITRTYVVAGLVASSTRLLAGGIKEVTYQSVRTESVPDGIVVTRSIQNPNGLPSYSVSALQRYDGGDLTSSTAQSYQKRVNFTYPGRAKPYYHTRDYSIADSKVQSPFTTPGVVDFMDVHLSPPITTPITATVDVSYSTTATVPAGLTFWSPKSWAIVVATWAPAWTHLTQASAKMEGLTGYRAIAPTQTSVTTTQNYGPTNLTGFKVYPVPSGLSYTPDTLILQGGVPRVVYMMGSTVRWPTYAVLTVSGGPPAPDGNTYVLDYDIEDAFISSTGVRYYRHIKTSAQIPSQDALPV